MAVANRDSLRQRFVTVQLTLLSIVVALILEGLLGVLLALEDWTPLVLVQSLDVLTSALAMWVGFAFSISVADKSPHLLDFLGPFALLIFLQLAVRFIAEGDFPAFLFAGACASLVAAWSLWLDVRIAGRHGTNGPVSTAVLLTGIGLFELALGAGLRAGLIGPTTGLALLAAITGLQTVGVGRSIHFWLASLRSERDAEAR